jgi:Nitroreductase
MNSFTSLITGRRSTRKFQQELFSPEQVALILKAALMAPTSKGANSWQFVVVEDKNMLQQLAACKKYGSDFLAGCTLAVVVLGDLNISDVWIEDASIAAIYMQLQAEELEVGSCWCQIRNRLTADGNASEQYVRKLLDIPGQFGVLSIIGFGYKDQERKPFDESNLLWEKVHIGTFRMQEITS